MTLMQLQFRHADGSRDFVAQKEFADDATNDDLTAWFDDVRTRHEPPSGACWELHNEQSEGFFWATVEQDGGAA